MRRTEPNHAAGEAGARFAGAVLGCRPAVFDPLEDSSVSEPLPTAAGEITRILHRLGGARADSSADRARVFELVYSELRRMASHLLARERHGHTLQPTALVHEAFIRLVDQTSLRPNDRAHFLAISARAMRRILIDHARAVGAEKRGGEWQRVTLASGDEPGAASDPAAAREFELLDLNQALERLAELDERAARVAELRLFAGATVREAAEALGVSPRSVDDDWATARAWLSREIRGGPPA
jgi:RNA polymerase sigma factor (TIGR02999 family)